MKNSDVSYLCVPLPQLPSPKQWLRIYLPIFISPCCYFFPFCNFRYYRLSTTGQRTVRLSNLPSPLTSSCQHALKWWIISIWLDIQGRQRRTSVNDSHSWDTRHTNTFPSQIKCTTARFFCLLASLS